MSFMLIIRKLEDTLTEEEKVVFDQWYGASPKHRNLFREVKDWRNHVDKETRRKLLELEHKLRLL